MAAPTISSSVDTRFDPERTQLKELIKQVGTLAEGMKSSAVQSVGWYLMSVELQQACLQMRTLQAKVDERSNRLSGSGVTRRVRRPRAHIAVARFGLGSARN
jgi:hypothetical protein